ncbi:hypothetical protein GCM10010174_73690 [Kutzneria viridogrisea]|uniref:HTH luxR-type domain-containing protein n=2 Tax=Kutzneria TaxID=43356 RepID=W5W7Q6_9PSEU|nr:response regulator transcription factor [Kutzneria albida]AHH96972.1 hypothetical protein KALB_3608 [Kutzneria albida DSM 43870]MBA8932063.1 DNA-binding NarL/FixJ family response regulator [Kutzneria viridogrisea]
MSSIIGEAQSPNRPAVLVVHQVPFYRIGLSLGLGKEGFDVAEASSLDGTEKAIWDACLVQFDVVGESKGVADLRARYPEAAVVVVVDEPSVTSYRSALAAGADGVAPQDVALPEMINVLKTAMDGRTLLPVSIAHGLVRHPGQAPSELRLPDAAVGWLRALSHGESIASIARSAGYSERQMYRTMQQLYHQIGAKNRQQAIVLATKWGFTAVESG